MSEKQNASDTIVSASNTSNENKMITNPAILVKTSKLPTKVEFAEDQKKVDPDKGE